MIKAVTGTKDILPGDINKWYYLEGIVRKIFVEYNYKEIRTPIFEETQLFARGIGEATDIVGKEMYSFLDNGKTSLTLKPEMTASVVRAYIEHSMAASQGLHKLFYISPMFRQERPQAGRLRQFHQFGAEALGSNSPALDAEMIIMSYKILKHLGLKDLEVIINSLGVPSTRENYKNILKEYLKPKFEKLSQDSKKRFDINILRIFDSKDENDKEIMKDAPLLLEHLDKESLDYFEVVKSLLNSASVPYKVDPKLVRGLDYYTHTTFEILSGSVGSQSALCGGGRYDLLAEQIGGKSSPGVGFAAGFERILLACENEKLLDIPADNVDVYLVRVGDADFNSVYAMAELLRNAGITVELDYNSRSMKAQMREANKFNSGFVLFYGGDELASNQITLKNMKDSSQKLFNIDKTEDLIKEIRG